MTRAEAEKNKADLRGADLRGANLGGADLRGADLRRADLWGADLRGANLREANLREADLWEADLRRANLWEADLRGADLRGADLRRADLRGANLRGANLREANLRRADLIHTILDPDEEPNQQTGSFHTKNGFIIGYRSRRAGHIDKYRDGRYYSADVFSVCDTECHPGLYLWPTLKAAKDWMPNIEIIRVLTRKTEVHKAGNKYRCRWFYVDGAAWKPREG